jgi:hypothetical protein
MAMLWVAIFVMYYFVSSCFVFKCEVITVMTTLESYLSNPVLAADAHRKYGGMGTLLVKKVNILLPCFFFSQVCVQDDPVPG